MNFKSLKIAIDLLTFEQICDICAFQFNLWSITTPKKVTFSCSFMTISFNFTDNNGLWRLKVNNIDWVFVKFIRSLFATNHSTTLFPSASSVDFNISNFEQLNKIVVSSAKTNIAYLEQTAS